MEKKQDAIMARTKNRPLIKKEVSPTSAFFFGIFLSAQGIGLLYFTTNLWATLLTALTLFLYLVVYTPLKQKTIYSTEIGALSGALPPLVGWCAANGEPSLYGFVLFGILFAWQMPHFMAIAYNHKKDYAKAGFKLQYEGEKQDFYLSRKSLIYGLILTTLVFYPFSVNLENNAITVHFIFVCLLAFSSFTNKMYKILYKFKKKQIRKVTFHRYYYIPSIVIINDGN